jgi:hypothetical protein
MVRQGELFGDPVGPGTAPAAPPLLRHQLTRWQSRLADHQAPLFAGLGSTARQGSLLENDGPPHWLFNPLQLQPQPLSFWRGAPPLVQGAALYFVMDQPEALEHPLLLYVGETARAEQRWKGEHDCKGYLAAYGDALQRAGLGTRLSIRFWCDVPAQTKARRQLEQGLIRHWLPPFNKETRGRWATPFQA